MKKLLVALLILVIAVGLADAGLTHTARIYDAAATGPADNPISILPGDMVILSYHAEKLVNSSIGMSTPYGYQVLSATNGGSASDIDITFANNFAPTTWPDYDDVGVIQLALDAGAPSGAVYEIQIYTGTTAATCYASASREIHAIPEFPTVALPVASIIGMAFIFQRRKQE